jgi:hypothetical protein
MADSSELIKARAIAVASEICATLDWKSERCAEIQKQQPNISSVDRACYSAFMLGDAVERLCGCLCELGPTADAISIKRNADDFRRAVWHGISTDLAAEMSADEIERWRELYGPFPLPPETKDERKSHEARNLALIGAAMLLHDQVLSVKQSLVESLQDSSAATGLTPNNASSDEAPSCYVTLLQMAAIVNRHKRTLQRLANKSTFPLPVVEGGRGKPSEWRWDEVRSVLEFEYGRSLPAVYPADRFVTR